MSGSTQTGTAQDARLGELVARLGLHDKIRLLTGASAWSTVALPEIGLASMVLSDGPSGVRGEVWDERSPSLCLPAISCLASSWDVELAREYGTAIGVEARRKGVHVVLGPTVNLQRSPLGGRNFEAFSEDPLLTAELATAYVAGVQSLGVAATLKHYVANDFETDRFTVDVRVAERTLRELYLRAFEKPITRAGAWCVMSAYNSINGRTATESPLLTTPLRDEWAFDGAVVSDWTAVRSLESARHPQDLAMPGPDGPWGDQLEQAVRAGDIAEELIDRKVMNLLRLASRVAALDGYSHPMPPPEPDLRAFARRVAVEGAVLLRNDGTLPLAAGELRRVAVIGEAARFGRVQGGGSATVVPEAVVSPLDGLRAALPAGVEVVHHEGAPTQEGIQAFLPQLMSHPEDGRPGAKVTFYSPAGDAMYSEDRFAGVIMDFAANPVDRERHAMSFETRYCPEASGRLGVGFAGPGHCQLFVDGRLQLETELFEPPDQVQAFFSPPSAAAEIDVTAGTPIDLRFRFTPNAIVDGVPGSFAVTFGTLATPPQGEAQARLIAEAAEVAAASDVAVVVVGTNAAVECEGYDRPDLRLPGGQSELVAAVAAANPRTIVVVNSGGPVELPWRDEVAALLLGWFGGQESGHALADIILGAAEPAGRLAMTWPAVLDDAPVTDVSPHGGELAYAEGLHIGYRAWARTGGRPAFPFGFGLGYTDWELGDVDVTRSADGSPVLGVTVANRGRRTGKQVVQAYAQRPDSRVERPSSWLVGFATVTVEPGETARVLLPIDPACLAHWEDGWQLEAGDYQFRVGTSSAHLSEPVTVRLPGWAAE